MASAEHDSSFSLHFISMDDKSETGPLDVAAPDAMEFFDLNSDSPLPNFPDDPRAPLPTINAAPRPLAQASLTGSAPTEPAQEGEGGIWLSGDSLMCACPECRAPMTIRIWLMVADCWKCKTSIELSEEQEREARRLLKKQEEQTKKRRPQTSAAGAPVAKTKTPTKNGAATGREQKKTSPKQDEGNKRQAPVAESKPDSKTGVAKTPPLTPRQHARQQAEQHRTAEQKRKGSNQPMVGARANIRKMAKTGSAYLWLSSLFRETPAWLVSMVFHMVLLVLLSLLTLDDSREEPLIMLSATVDKNVKEGDDAVIIDEQNPDFDLPVPKDFDPNDQEQRESMLKNDQQAKQLRIDPDANVPLPELHKVKNQIARAGNISSALSARDPRLRVEMVKMEGGTTLTEAAVARGLDYLASVQQPDGSWKLGSARSPTAATSLALFPFFGAGQTHIVGRYQENVAKGVRWMVDQQKENGDMRGQSAGNAGMYAHGQSTIVLCEAFLMSGDEELRAPAQKAVDFIVKAQLKDGGWRYAPVWEAPNDRGDTSVVGWQIMALQSAKAAGLTVDKSTLVRAGHFLDSVSSRDGALYSYLANQQPKHTMTAEGLLCRMYLGWTKDDIALGEGIKWLQANHLPSRNKKHDIYYYYYGTQAMHHYGGEPWEMWNSRMREILVEQQVKSGPHAGSWSMGSPHSGGRVYETSLAICTLEVYYRHLPIFRQIDLD
jgi:hypothetical protein